MFREQRQRCMLACVMCVGREIVKFILAVLCFQYFAKASGNIRRNFATKSRYPQYNDDNHDIVKVPNGCSPLHLNMVLRHGTRYPGKKDIKGMDELAGYINQFHNKETTYGNLKMPWVNRFKYGDKFLAKVGAEELYNISRRIRRKFPSLFSPKYSGEQHYFVSTMTPRTSQSASAFSFGLFEGTGVLGPSKFQPVAITTTNLTEPLLRFFDICSEYIQRVSENKEISLVEFHKFKDGEEMTNLKAAFAKRLNITDHSGLTSAHIQYIFLSCAYELAIYGDGQLCSILHDSELDIIEYMYDIKNYWKRGYGYKINYDMSCLLLKNLTESIENVVKSLGTSVAYTQAIFHFSHAETIIPLVCLMGLFKDNEPLLANNYRKQKNRQFRTANIAPFSGNIAVVLYSCKSDDEKSGMFYVQVLANEIPAALPCCDAKELCPLNQFRACFRHIVEQCDLHSICNSPSNHNEL
ncbi:multiple inositol polyphosphate phosphatase 1-like [Dendronephthya gigantea]|uniref:multiple inositol polyphosphate phosphatase 1-like n=1 Tax=Dendronephthya gigantea TaxID=151771 RepID=UPI00106BFFF5|nr:multiple inositol polyphosphate phosphatase 1-like [Dendronephthya gigantea]